MKDFHIIEDKSDDILLKLGAILGANDINIEGFCLVSDEQKMLHTFCSGRFLKNFRGFEKFKLQCFFNI